MIRAILSILLIGLISSPSLAGAASKEEQVNFQGANGATLAGTLQIPAGRGASPALVLLAGSGPTDRDGNQPPAIITDLLKQIAQELADQGIVSLRFDKRGMYANAADLPKDEANYGDFFSWENFVGDAVAACRFLRQQPAVDPNRVGILGHSEGGLLALEAARTMKSQGHAPAVLILISTPGRTVDIVIADQLKNLLAREHASGPQTDYFLGENARITRAILQTGQVPPDVPPGLATLYPQYLGKFLRSELALDPRKVSADFSGPVMIVAGAADTQVSPELDANALDAALSARKGDVHSLAIIPNASHNLKFVRDATDAGFQGPIVPAAMDQLRQWTVEHLAQK